MEHHRTGFVMRNADRGRGIAATVIRPANKTGEQFLRPLKPFRSLRLLLPPDIQHRSLRSRTDRPVRE